MLRNFHVYLLVVLGIWMIGLGIVETLDPLLKQVGIGLMISAGMVSIIFATAGNRS